MAPEVAEQLGELHATVERLAASDSPPAAELGELYGRLGALYLLYNLDRAAETALANARTLAPADPRWSYYLGTLLQRQRRNDEASQAFEEALAVWAPELTDSDPAASSATPPTEADAPLVLPTLLRLGRVAFNDGRHDEAVRWYARALELAPDSAAALFGLAQVEQERGDLESAVARYERVLEMAPHAGAAQARPRPSRSGRPRGGAAPPRATRRGPPRLRRSTDGAPRRQRPRRLLRLLSRHTRCTRG